MGTKTNIMIVDDSFTNRVFFRAILEELDFNVTEVHSGMKALRLLDKSKPDVILLDMCMPQMNGLDFLSELKRLNKNIPVIIASVLDDKESISQAYQYGACDYLVKPVEVEELIRRIAKYSECELSL